MSLITPSLAGRIPSFKKVGTVLALVNMWMFDGLKVFLIIYSSGVAFMVRICDISFCQRGNHHYCIKTQYPQRTRPLQPSNPKPEPWPLRKGQTKDKSLKQSSSPRCLKL